MLVAELNYRGKTKRVLDVLERTSSLTVSELMGKPYMENGKRAKFSFFNVRGAGRCTMAEVLATIYNNRHLLSLEDKVYSAPDLLKYGIIKDTEDFINNGGKQ